MSKKQDAMAQGAFTDYALHTLGWKSFQDLCVAVATEVLGQAVEVFLPSRDGGRDGAFVAANSTQKSTIQCKSTSSPNQNISLSDVKSELRKISSLTRRGLAHDYILMTNLGVSGNVAAELRDAFCARGVKNFRIYGRDWITAQIRERPRLRMMVPRVYGLGDLSQIIDERAYSQARYIISAMGDDLRCFVTTDAHRRSVDAITRHGFVLLLGDPASGKSTIGATLAVGALDDGAIGTIRVTSPQEFKQHWNPHEPNQFFWVDDAFGPTQYQRAFADGWNQELPTLRAAIKAGARVLFTSRTYIWEAARRDLKISQFPLLGKSQVIIDVQGLSDDERAQILYNHVRLGDQPPAVRRTLKPLLASAAINPNFLPETARRLGANFFTGALQLTIAGLTTFIDKPVEFLQEVLENLDGHSQAAIAILFLQGSGGVPSPLRKSDATKLVERLFNASLANMSRALENLNGSLVLLIQHPDEPRWAYKHPTIADAFAALVARSPELVELYIQGAKRERLLGEVVCGEIAIEGAAVQVPKSLYEQLTERIGNPDDYYARVFLTERADAPFLRSLVARYPDLVEDLTRGINTEMAYDSHSNLLARMKQLGVLPEYDRVNIAIKISDLTIEFVDSSVYRDAKLRSLLNDDELEELRARIEHEIHEKLDAVIESWRDDWVVTDKRAHMERLKDSLVGFRRYADHDTEDLLQGGIDRVDLIMSEIEDADERASDRHAAPTAPVSPSTTHLATIFDDIDE